MRGLLASQQSIAPSILRNLSLPFALAARATSAGDFSPQKERSLKSRRNGS